MKKSLVLFCLIGVSMQGIDAKVSNKVHLQIKNKIKVKDDDKTATV